MVGTATWAAAVARASVARWVTVNTIDTQVFFLVWIRKTPPWPVLTQHLTLATGVIATTIGMAACVPDAVAGS